SGGASPGRLQPQRDGLRPAPGPTGRGVPGAARRSEVGRLESPPSPPVLRASGQSSATIPPFRVSKASLPRVQGRGAFETAAATSRLILVPKPGSQPRLPARSFLPTPHFFWNSVRGLERRFRIVGSIAFSPRGG